MVDGLRHSRPHRIANYAIVSYAVMISLIPNNLWYNWAKAQEERGINHDVQKIL